MYPDLRGHVMTSFLSGGGLVCTGDTIEYPVGRKWYGAIKYAEFTVGRITGASVVLMSDPYGDIEITRGQAVTFTRANQKAVERIRNRSFGG